MFCLPQAGGSNNEKVSYEGFYSWLMLEPQTLVWLPTFHRILATETGIDVSFVTAVHVYTNIFKPSPELIWQ